MGKKQRLILLAASAMFFFTGFEQIYADEMTDKSISWLKAQIVPNDTIPNPVQERRRLILSYRLPESDPAYPYISGKSFIYDDALAVIAFTMKGEYKYSEYILSAMERLLNENGSIWFSCNTQNSWPSPEDHHGAVIRSGALAWAGYAPVYYLLSRQIEEPGFAENDYLAGQYLAMAEKIAGYLKNRQITDKKDKRYGLVTGGEGSYVLEYSSETKNVEEVFRETAIDWVSMEHNIDAFFLFRDLGRLTGKKEWADAAEMVKDSLMKNMWDKKHNQFFRGIKGDGKLDLALPLDGASWGSLFLTSVGAKGKALKSLEEIERNFKTEDKGFKGYGPYHDENIYESPEIASALLGPGIITWRDVSIVWSEGSLGAAAAYIRAGDPEKGRQIISEAAKMSDNGGLLYVSSDVPYHFSAYPSVAGTAWYIIADHLLSRPDDLFWSK